MLAAMASYSWKAAAFLKIALSMGLVAAGCSSQPEPTCTDGARNGEESDVDCGGHCGPCAEGQGCNAPADCESRMCAGDVCATPLCGDGVINQESEDCDDAGESAGCDADCTAALCGDGYTNMIAGEDCDDGNADDSDDCTSICELADCTDAIRNADESDVDCGGHCGPASCAPGQMCRGDGDCTSSSCVGGTCESAGATLVTGGWNTCALTTTGAVRCWGRNLSGELGLGHTTGVGDDELPSSAPDVDVGGAVVELVAGAFHVCALLSTGTVRCWGDNDHGQLGLGHSNRIGDDELPSAAGDVDLGGTVIELIAGEHHTCALLSTGAVRCWGYNYYGQLGYGHTDNIGDDELPSSAGDVDLGGAAVQITAGGLSTCALLAGGAVRCWGWNYYGQLGYGHTDDIGDDELPSSAGDVSIGQAAVHVDMGWDHVCALLDTGALRCWGRNQHGQLGHGNTDSIGDDELPSAAGDVDLGGTVIQVAAAYYRTCALVDTGAVRCWGNNEYGQLGYGHVDSIGDDELPSSAGDVSVGGAVARIALGQGFHTCALLESGAVRCWGNNIYGQLGYGNVNHIGDNELPAAAGDVPYQ